MIGYCVNVTPQLASFRLRVALPALYLERPYRIGATGDVNFFYKDGDPALAAKLPNVVYDVVNDHFASRPSYRQMCELATKITTASHAMAETVYAQTGREATVIDDPYENDEKTVTCAGFGVLWFGHSANLSSLSKQDLGGLDLTICSNTVGIPWTPDSERACINDAGVVICTGNNVGASANRIVKSLRAGRAVVAQRGIPAWEQFESFIWLGDIRAGVEWVFNNREEACERTLAGQKYIAENWHPKAIAAKWRALFDSILEPETNDIPVGSRSISKTDSATSRM